MNILSDGSGSSKEADGCGGKLIQKTGSFVKRRSRKSSGSNEGPKTNYTDHHDASIDIIPQKTYIFWILILIVFFMAAVNFTILVIMMNVLRIGEGMEGMEMVSKEEVKFYGNSDFDYVFYGDGTLKGFRDVPLEVTGNEGPVLVSVKRDDDDDDDMTSSLGNMRMTDNEISFNRLDRFDVVDPVSRANIFSTDDKHFRIPKGLPHLDVKKLRVNRLVSAHNSNLTIRSDSITRLRGNEGVTINGKEITFAADGDIFLNSVNGSVYLLADNVKIDMKRISVAPSRAKFEPLPATQYKLCICMPQGVLFRVPILKNIKSHLACSFVDLSPGNNPCVK